MNKNKNGMSCREVGPTRGLGRFNFVGVPTTMSESAMATSMATMKEAETGAWEDEKGEGGRSGGSRSRSRAGCGGEEEEAASNKWDQAMCDAALIVAISEATEFILRKLQRCWIIFEHYSCSCYFLLFF